MKEIELIIQVQSSWKSSVCTVFIKETVTQHCSSVQIAWHDFLVESLMHLVIRRQEDWTLVYCCWYCWWNWSMSSLMLFILKSFLITLLICVWESDFFLHWSRMFITEDLCWFTYCISEHILHQLVLLLLLIFIILEFEAWVIFNAVKKASSFTALMHQWGKIRH